VSAYEPFAPIYDDWASHMTEDVPFYVELAREADGPVVELAVGNGRVAIPVSKAIGPMLGIDLSPAMLAQARERAAEAGVERPTTASGPSKPGSDTGSITCPPKRGSTSRSTQETRSRSGG